MTRKRRNPREPHVPDPIAGLVDERLIGAACKGFGGLFDDTLDAVDETRETRSRRHALAARICARCGVQAACETAATEHAAHGIWNGKLRNATAPVGRPRKAS